jgi:hypothetical protein
VKGGFFSL